MKSKFILFVLAYSLLVTTKLTALELTACDQLMLISAYTSNNVYVFNACDGEFIQVLDTEGRISGAQATRIGPDGQLYIASEINGKILRYDSKTLTFIDEFSAGVSINEPTGLAFGPDGDLYVASFADDKIIKLDGTTGQYLGDFASGIDGPDAGMVFGPAGKLYVPSFFGNRIHVLDGESGVLVHTITGQLRNPRVVTFEPGNGSFVVSVSGSGSISRYSGAGVFENFVTQSFNSVSGLAYRKDGALFAISDTNGRARPVDPASGEIGDFLTGPEGILGATFITFMDFVSAEPVNTNQFWVVGVGNITGLTISVDADAFVFANGGVFGDAFDPTSVDLSPFGTLEITLIACSQATLTYNSIGNAGMGSGGYDLEKIGGNVSLAQCLEQGYDENGTSINALTGAWFGGPDRNGEGFFVDVLENGTAIVAWFTFGAANG